MRKARFSLLVALILAAVVIILTAANNASLVNQPENSTLQKQVRPQVTYAFGTPAIHPQTELPVAYTKETVIRFLKTYPFPGGPTVIGKAPTIVMIGFISSKAASILMKGEQVDRPDNTIVCYVQLHGPFIATRISAPSTTLTAKPIYNIGEMVFDAHTGNLLLWGVRP